MMQASISIDAAPPRLNNAKRTASSIDLDLIPATKRHMDVESIDQSANTTAHSYAVSEATFIFSKMMNAKPFQEALSKVSTHEVLVTLISLNDSSLVRKFFENPTICGGKWMSFLGPKHSWDLNELFIHCTSLQITEEIKKIMFVLIANGAMSTEASRKIGKYIGAMSIQWLKFLENVIPIKFDYYGALGDVINHNYRVKSSYSSDASCLTDADCSKIIFLIENCKCIPNKSDMSSMLASMKDSDESHFGLFKLMFNAAGGAPSIGDDDALDLVESAMKNCQLSVFNFITSKEIGFEVPDYSDVTNIYDHPINGILKTGRTNLIQIFKRRGMDVNPHIWMWRRPEDYRSKKSQTYVKKAQNKLQSM